MKLSASTVAAILAFTASASALPSPQSSTDAAAVSITPPPAPTDASVPDAAPALPSDDTDYFVVDDDTIRELYAHLPENLDASQPEKRDDGKGKGYINSGKEGSKGPQPHGSGGRWKAGDHGPMNGNKNYGGGKPSQGQGHGAHGPMPSIDDFDLDFSHVEDPEVARLARRAMNLDFSHEDPEVSRLARREIGHKVWKWWEKQGVGMMNLQVGNPNIRNTGNYKDQVGLSRVDGGNKKRAVGAGRGSKGDGGNDDGAYAAFSPCRSCRSARPALLL